MSTFDYTIDDYNPAERYVRVTFDDGAWARIALAEPLPANAQQLDMIVRHYTASQERMAAQTSGADLSFITDLVGQQRTVGRFSVKNSLEGDPQIIASPLAPVTLDDHRLVAAGRVAQARFVRETAGLPLADGRVFPTDRETQSKVTAKFVAAMAAQQAAAGDPNDPATAALQALAASLAAINWKLTDGSFITFDLASFMGVAIQAAGWVQGAFDWEKDKLAALADLDSIEAIQEFCDHLGGG